MRRIFFLFLVLAAVVTSACQNEEPSRLPLSEGTYSGTFTVKYADRTKTGSASVQILADNEFIASGNRNRVPAGGSGTFSEEGRMIRFSDKNFWTADFDWTLILSGDFEYSFDGRKLLLKRVLRNGVTVQEYNLVKQ